MRAADPAQTVAALRGLEARPAGIRAILPYVDEFLPVHDVASFTDISAALEDREERLILRAEARFRPPAA